MPELDASIPFHSSEASPMTALMQDIDACVFEAYGTLFDFTATAGCYRDDLGDKEKALFDLWWARQLKYS